MAAGYDISDPQANAIVGYRSHGVGNKKADQVLAGADVSYNGFTFPPALSAKVSVVQEYDKTGRTVKWLTIALTVEAVITDHYASVSEMLSDPEEHTADATMDDIKARLSQPCQVLSFNVQGFGDMTIQGVPPGVTPAPSVSHYDVDYGPKPQVLEWEPIAGALGVKIQWLVTSRISACTTNRGLNGILEFYYGISWSFDSSGFMTRTIAGGMELPRTRSANVATNHALSVVQLGLDHKRFNDAVNMLKTTFPIVGGWERTESFKISEDKKKLTFSLTDAEYRSPQSPPPGIVKIALKERLASDLATDGFYKWVWSFGAQIEVVNSKNVHDITSNKYLAVLAFYYILRDRTQRVKNSVLRALRRVESGRHNTTYLSHGYAFPLRIEIGNDMYSNSLDIAITFQLNAPAGYLFQISGMLDSVRAQVQSVGDWDSWAAKLKNDGAFVAKLAVLPGAEGIVDLCHPMVPSRTTNPSSPKRNPTPLNQKPTIIKDSDYDDPDATWTSYESMSEYSVDWGTTVGVPLSPEVTETQETVTPNNNRNTRSQVTPKQEGQGAGYMVPVMSTGRQPYVIVTIKGRAERIGYPINAPELRSIGGIPVVKYGVDKIVPSTRPGGFIQNGVVGNIYRLAWRKSYILTNPPREWLQETNNQPQMYT